MVSAWNQAGEGEVVVESEHLPSVVESLDVVAGWGVLGAPIPTGVLVLSWLEI